MLNRETINAMLKQMEEEGVETVRLQFTDITGTLKSIAVTPAKFAMLKEEPFFVDGTFLAGRDGEDGVELMLCSAYRSIEKQQQLFDRSQQAYMAQGMSEEEAYAKTATETAIPGTSEHQTGLAADIVTPTYQMLDAGFADTPAGQWLSEHAAEYGFVLRYPQDKQEVTGIIYESWHYRFVGKTHAKLMKESGLCLEEYLQQELPEGYTGASEPYDLPKQP